MATKVFVIASSGDKDVLKWPGLRWPMNASKKQWVDEVKVILFGPAEEVVAYDSEIQQKIRDLQEAGVEVMACKACADEKNVSGKLEELGIKVVFVGSVISELIKDGWTPLTF